jgi:50S ribosomal subunit-associated GTPase HflX
MAATTDGQPHTENAELGVVVVGYTGAGKTSTITRLVSETFSQTYVATPGVAPSQTIKHNHDGENVIATTIFTEIGGKEYYSTLEREHIERADTVIVVINLSWKGRCDSCADKIVALRRSVPDATPIILVATHLDSLEPPPPAIHAKLAHVKVRHDVSAVVEASVYAGKMYLVSCKTGEGFDSLLAGLVAIHKTRWQFRVAAKKAALVNARGAIPQPRWPAAGALLCMTSEKGSPLTSVVAAGALAAAEAYAHVRSKMEAGAPPK